MIMWVSYICHAFYFFIAHGIH